MSKATKIFLAIILAAVLTAAALVGYNHWYWENHFTVENTVYDRESETLDLRGTGISVEHYEALRQELPDCAIRWDIPFQGGFLADDTTELTVSTLSQEDVDMLDYLPGLKTVEASGCRDYDLLLELQERHPDCAIRYTVTILGDEFRNDTTQLRFDGEDPDAAELMAAMAYLPALESVHFEEPEMAAADLLALREQYPGVDITWVKTVFGEAYSDNVTELDFSDIKMQTVDEVESAMAYFPSLEKLVMCDCGIDNETMAAFRDRAREHYKVVWSVKVGNTYIRTDDTYFMPVKYGITVFNDTVQNLKYCEDMLCVDLGHKEVWNISFVEGMPHLKYLIVADGPIRDITPISSCKELVYVEFFDTQIRDYSPLLGCTALEDVNLAQTFGDPTVLGEMTWLKNLWLNLNGVSAEDRAYLTECLPDTHIEFDHGFLTGGGWRQLQNYYDMRDLLEMPYNTW